MNLKESKETITLDELLSKAINGEIHHKIFVKQGKNLIPITEIRCNE